MAQKTVVSLIDDLDGESEADETVEYALDGVTYEIDLAAITPRGCERSSRPNRCRPAYRWPGS